MTENYGIVAATGAAPAFMTDETLVLALVIAIVAVAGILFVLFRKAGRGGKRKGGQAESAAASGVASAPEEGFVKASHVFCGAQAEDRDAALRFIADRAVEAGIADDADALLAAFLKREAEGTTGMVDGFAIPHAKSGAVREATVMVLKTVNGISAWETLDGSAVNCAIALLVPDADASTTHLQILSKVAAALTDDAFRAACAGTDDPATIARLINERLA